MNQNTLRKTTYAGLFMITLASLMYEILLTRIFSVTMWYHFAFVAVSLALFGMTVGAVLVYLLPRFFTQERAQYHLALSSLLFSITIVLSFLTHLSVPFISDPSMSLRFSLVELYAIVITYVALSVPFIFSGIAVCLALTKFPRQVSRLYAADLAGAAVGCVLLILVLGITDGPTAVIVVAALASIGSLLFAWAVSQRGLRWAILITGLIFVGFAVSNTLQAQDGAPWLRLIWVKGKHEPPPLYENWNSFSRIRIDGSTKAEVEPFGWGLSPTIPEEMRVNHLALNIDATAGTFLVGFDGDLAGLEFLKYDITNLAHYIRPNADVLVVGSGGGRDILSALAFEQKSVVGVEINGDIIDAVNGRFGDFTGHLDQHPKVTFIEDEARSYIARTDNEYGILQVSMIDTWAATAAGAFVLSESTLYTVEAWDVFLDHLTPDGVLTFTRWYFGDRPGEMYRLTSLASASLIERGIQNPREHMMIVRYMGWQEFTGSPDGVGTILVSKEPFSDQDVDRIEQVCEQMQFEIVLTPRFAIDNVYATLATGQDLESFAASYPIDIAAPTDDSPFFFHMLRLRDIFRPELQEQGGMSINMRAIVILGVLLITVVVLTVIGIIVPLTLTTEKAALRGAMPLSIYFCGIGLGFMLVEISQMQRLIVFLGHPIYSLSVVLFTLLLASGVGSFLTQKVGQTGLWRSPTVRLLLLLGVLILFGFLTPYVTRFLQAANTPIRILAAVGILFPLGLFMGMAFPIGMKVATRKSATITPWLWGINGAMSVCASVLAVVIALSSSISTSFWVGFSCYLVAFGAFLWTSRDVLKQGPKGS
jgi:hypothetical protein